MILGFSYKLVDTVLGVVQGKEWPGTAGGGALGSSSFAQHGGPRRAAEVDPTVPRGSSCPGWMEPGDAAPATAINPGIMSAPTLLLNAVDNKGRKAFPISFVVEMKFT